MIGVLATLAGCLSIGSLGGIAQLTGAEEVDRFQSQTGPDFLLASLLRAGNELTLILSWR